MGIIYSTLKCPGNAQCTTLHSMNMYPVHKSMYSSSSVGRHLPLVVIVTRTVNSHHLNYTHHQALALSLPLWWVKEESLIAHWIGRDSNRIKAVILCMLCTSMAAIPIWFRSDTQSRFAYVHRMIYNAKLCWLCCDRCVPIKLPLNK